jgi:dTDP-4-dehydrorhamnose 3,5-epimerase
MKIIQSPLEGAFEIIPDVYGDSRGYFFESFNKKNFREATGLDINFVQDNESYSTYGVIRGLHYQESPYAQAKLVRVIEGEILDVIVDIRKNSPSYGEYYSTILSGENKKQIFVPKGFAHGLAVTSKFARLAYKCDEYYKRDSEGGIFYDDSMFSINWMIPKKDRILSQKDLALQAFSTIK